MAAWTLPAIIAEWCEILTSVLDRRSRKYFFTIILGMLLGCGRRTVSCWLRAAGVSDDSPTKRYGPKVQLAGMHHNPTPGPSGSEFLYGHVWVTISWLVKHPQWGCIGMPLLALMYVRQKDLQILERIGKAPWKFRTKLELAAELVEWCVTLFKNWFRKRVMVVADGAYAKRPFLKRVKATGAVVVSRLRKDAAMFDVPEAAKRPGRGRPRKYGRNQISLAHRGGHRHGWTTTWMVLYGKEQTVTFKTFLATYAPADGVIRVVIVKRSVELFSDCSAEWVKIPGTQHFHRGLVDPRSGTAGTILRRDDHPGFCFAATRSDRPAIDQQTAHSSPPASARSRAARRSMLPEVPQTRRRPAVRKEPSLKSDTQHTGVLHSCLVASRVCGADRPVPPSVV